MDFNIRFDKQPKQGSPKSFIGVYNFTLDAPKHELLQSIDLDGNLTKQRGKFETFNLIAYRCKRNLKEFNLNVVINRNQTGDDALQTHFSISLPFKYLPFFSAAIPPCAWPQRYPDTSARLDRTARQAAMKTSNIPIA